MKTHYARLFVILFFANTVSRLKGEKYETIYQTVLHWWDSLSLVGMVVAGAQSSVYVRGRGHVFSPNWQHRKSIVAQKPLFSCLGM